MQPYRLNAPTSDDLDTTVSEHLAANTQASVVLQFSSPEQYPAHLLKRVDALCSQYGERINVRFWGHCAGQPFDATTLSELPNVQSLILNGLSQVIAVETLGALEAAPQLIDPQGVGKPVRAERSCGAVLSLTAPQSRPDSSPSLLSTPSSIGSTQSPTVGAARSRQIRCSCPSPRPAPATGNPHRR